jgi:hypothetical protein
MVLTMKKAMPMIRDYRKIGYDDRSGTPEGIPRDFIELIIEFPERIYGTWWLSDENGSRGHIITGWYIWIESVNLLGINYLGKTTWHTHQELEAGLTIVVNRLHCT